MLMKAPGGGGNERDVVFTLRVQQDSKTLDQIRDFGDQIRKEQEAIYSFRPSGQSSVRELPKDFDKARTSAINLAGGVKVLSDSFGELAPKLDGIIDRFRKISDEWRKLQETDRDIHFTVTSDAPVTPRGRSSARTTSQFRGGGSSYSGSPGLEGESFKQRRLEEIDADASVRENKDKAEQEKLDRQMSALNKIYIKGLRAREDALEKTLKELDDKTKRYDAKQEAAAKRAEAREEAAARRNAARESERKEREERVREIYSRVSQEETITQGQRSFSGASDLLRSIAYGGAISNKNTRGVIDTLLAVESARSFGSGILGMAASASPRVGALAAGIGTMSSALTGAIVGGGLGINAIREERNGTVGGVNDWFANGIASSFAYTDKLTGAFRFLNRDSITPYHRQMEGGFFGTFADLSDSNISLDKNEKKRDLAFEARQRRRMIEQLAYTGDQQRSNIEDAAGDRQIQLAELQLASTMSPRQRFGRQQLASDSRLMAISEQIANAQNRGDLQNVPGLLSQRDSENAARFRRMMDVESEVAKQRQAALAPETFRAEAEIRTRKANEMMFGVGDDEKRKNNAEAIAQAEDRVARLRQQSLQISLEEARTRQQVLSNAIQSTQQELSMRRQMIEGERDRLRSAKERFGAMDETRQKEVIDVVTQLRLASNMDNEANKLEAKGMGGNGTDRLRKESEAIRNKITPEQLQLISQVGLDQSLVSDELTRKADKGGFAVLGAPTERRIEDLERTKKELEVTLKDQRALSVKIERDDNELSARVVAEITALLEDRDKQLLKVIEANLKEQKLAIVTAPGEALRRNAVDVRAAVRAQ